MRGRPGDAREDGPFITLTAALHRLAERVYSDDLGKKNACQAYIAEMRQIVLKENYVAHTYDPFETLVAHIRDIYPEVWRGDNDNYSGEEAYELFLSTPAPEDEE